MFCKHCGVKTDDDANFCPKCGKSTSSGNCTGTVQEKIHGSDELLQQGTVQEKIHGSDELLQQAQQYGTSLTAAAAATAENVGTLLVNVHDLDLKEMETISDLRILLVGHTGHGKSATGNTLLGKEEFEQKRSTKSVTRKISRKVVHRFGRIIEIVDTPGLYDTSGDDDHVQSELIKCIGLTIPGFNAIVFVLRPDRFTPEIINTVDLFLKFFGKNVDDFAFLLLTHTPNTKDQEEFLQDSHLKFDEIKRRCKNKVLKIDNVVDTESKTKFAWDIFEAIDKANEKIKEPYFTNAMIENVDWYALWWKWPKILLRNIEERNNEYASLIEEQERRESFKKKLENDKSFLEKLRIYIRGERTTSLCVLL